MLEGLQAEIGSWPTLRGAGPKIVIDALNADGSFMGTYTDDAEWRISDTPVMISISALMTEYLSQQSGQNFTDFLEAEGSFNRYVERLLNGVEGAGIDLSLSTVRDLFTYLYQTYAICTESEYLSLLRLGERQLSRAEELTFAATGTARLLTVEDFK